MLCKSLQLRDECTIITGYELTGYGTFRRLRDAIAQLSILINPKEYANTRLTTAVNSSPFSLEAWNTARSTVEQFLLLFS